MAIEPYGYAFQHEDTGLEQVVDVQQVEWGFEKNNPRWKKIGLVYPESALADKDAELSLLSAQNEWLKDRLSDLQLPANSPKNIEEWLIECGMPTGGDHGRA